MQQADLPGCLYKKRKPTKQIDMKHAYLLLMAVALCGTACTSPGEDYEQIAAEACECMEPLSGLYAELKEAMDHNDLEALDDLEEEIEQTNEDVDSCAEALEEKYGKLEGTRGEAVKLAMKNKCPEIILIMNEVEQQLVK